jgi:hypothetical protein
VTDKREFLAWASMLSADFDSKTLLLRVHGDMPPVFSGRYAVVDFDKFRMTVMQAKLWADNQQKEPA